MKFGDRTRGRRFADSVAHRLAVEPSSNEPETSLSRTFTWRRRFTAACARMRYQMLLDATPEHGRLA